MGQNIQHGGCRVKRSIPEFKDCNWKGLNCFVDQGIWALIIIHILWYSVATVSSKRDVVLIEYIIVGT